jgi:hypothetical protein
MEGNLKGARHSLSSTGLSSHYYSAQRARQSYMSSKQQSTPGHSRAASEASVPSPVPSLPVNTTTRSTTMPKRSSSALGSFASLGVLDRGVSLRGAKSQEAMRESRLKHWILDDRAIPPPMDLARSASSTGHHHFVTTVSPTPSDLPRRPVSQASEIRAQMSELKDRISEIKERARENIKRASTLSLRAASPMGSEKSHTYSDPLKSSAPSVVNRKSTSPGESPKSADFAVKNPPRQYTPAHDGIDEMDGYPESYYGDAAEHLDNPEEESHKKAPHSRAVDSPLQQRQMVHETSIGDVLEELPEELDEEAIENGSVSGETVYFEAEQTFSAGRHEDRLDAFDYENFFLHSAMGTYSRNQRRDSISSEGSVETTRPASPLRTAEALDAELGVTEADSSDIPSSPLGAVHERNMSVESISSIASFQTATESFDEDFNYDEEGLEYDDLDAITDQVILDNSYSPTKAAIVHSRQSLSPRKHPGPSPLVPLPSPPTVFASSMSPVKMMASRPSSGLLSSFIGLDAMDSAPDIVHRDRALVESVVSALQRCSLELQRSRNERRDDWRERLTEARRILEGLEDEGF